MARQQPPDDARRLAAALARARAAAMMSQGAFAALLGVSQQTISDWEAGRRNPLRGSTLLRAWWSGPWRGAIIIAQAVREAFPPERGEASWREG